MNKVFLKGNVGQDPTITDFQNGGKIAQFTLATTERGFTTRGGKKPEQAPAPTPDYTPGGGYNPNDDMPV